jgi:ribosomal protein S18 acetylase RimI-like enzyme
MSDSTKPMSLHLRPALPEDVDPLIDLTLLAFEPVFASFARILGPQIFAIVYPDWRETQQSGVQRLFENEQFSVRVAEIDAAVVGLIAYALNQESRAGTVEFLAVHPAYQNRGIGTALNELVLQEMRGAGMIVADVGTGGDESHAPARRAYEKAGYTAALPIVRYYIRL